MTHFFRLIRTALTVGLLALVVGVAGGLIYLNQVGFPGQSGEWLKAELAQRGVHLAFETLRFDLKRGLIATEVSFYQNADRTAPLLEASEIQLDLDKSKALRGIFKLHDITVTDGTARIPVDDQGRLVTASQIDGGLVVTESGRLILQKASGLIEGIRVTLSADLKLANRTVEHLDPDQQKALSSNHALSLVLDELSLWTLPAESPPELCFHIKGDLNEPERLQTSFELSATMAKRNDYQLTRLSLAGDLQSQVVTLDTILLQDESGTASGQADWCVSRRDGRFELHSTLRLQEFMQTCFGISVLADLTLESAPALSVKGRYEAQENGRFSVKATGHGEIRRFSLYGTNYEQLSSDFSWRDGDLYLPDLKVIHGDDQLNGTLVIEGDEIQFDVRSTLPLKAFGPLIKPDGKLEKSLSHLDFQNQSILALDAYGAINRRDLTEWSSAGKIHLSNFSYKGTRLHHLSTDYEIGSKGAVFSEVRALLNDEEEIARTRFLGQASEEIYAREMRYDPREHLFSIEDLSGTTWPTPIVRMFAPKTARHIERSYRFHQRPKLTLNGSFATRRGDRERSRFQIAVRTQGKTDYPFLGSDLPLTNLQADVSVEGGNIQISNLSAETMSGTASGAVTCQVAGGKPTKYRGSIKWDNLSFREMSRIYKFADEEKGKLTGNIDFRGIARGVRGFNAEGLIAINGGNLVSLPVLGPLSPIIAGVLGDKRMGYERAKDASARFIVKNGVLETDDFVAVSTSIVLTGEGWIDLLTEKLDMTIRVNARGLLGFLTLPLQPFKGIFQFRGTGTYDQPSWVSAPFTRPARGKRDPIFQKPARAEVVPE